MRTAGRYGVRNVNIDARSLAVTITRLRGAATLALSLAVLAVGATAARAAAPVMGATMEVTPSNPERGQLASVGVRVHNLSDKAITGTVTVELTLPEGMTPLWGEWPWDCPEVTSDTITCNYVADPALAAKVSPKDSLYVFVDVAADAPAGGEVVATVSGGGASQSRSVSSAVSFGDGSDVFRVTRFGGWASNPDGTIASQAGGHPDLRTQILTTLGRNADDYLVKGYDNMKDVEVELPPGLIANPQSLPRCPMELVVSPYAAMCPPETQVGTLGLFMANSVVALYGEEALYNVEPPPGVPARFTMSQGGVLTNIDAVVAADREHGYVVKGRVTRGSQTLPVIGAEVSLWGVPQVPENDFMRWLADPTDQVVELPPASTSAPPRPFVTAPVSCGGDPLVTKLSVAGWRTPGVSRASFDRDLFGDPIVTDGCEKIAFIPSAAASATTRHPDAPTGLDVRLNNPLNLEAVDGLANGQLKDVSVTLPEGLSINPSSGDGLAACSDAELGLGNDEPARCPAGSKIGSATAVTPLLAEEIEGSLFVRSQASDDPESGEMFRVALVFENAERGIRVKLAGGARVSSETGRLTASFDANPQLPVERVTVKLKQGPRAPLATSRTCGTGTVAFDVTSWAGHDVDLSDAVAVDCPSGSGFAPAFDAGSTNPTGGRASVFAAQIDRPDRQGYLEGVSVDLPRGLLAKLAGVPLCPDADAAAGSCPSGSRIGSATVGAGAGSHPYHLEGQPVYLAGPYKGAPYSLSVAARAVAGPFDLGTVVVRQALHVDPETAEVRVKSDPLPRIVKGVPIRLRSVEVVVDRPNFMRNPTSCAPKLIDATLRSFDGEAHASQARFQASDCQALRFKPRLAMRLTGKRQVITGRHPGVRAVLTQGAGQANIRSARVALPGSVALDASNAYDPKLVCDYDKSLKADCPQSTVIGKATARTPLLDEPLSGQVHLVQGIRFENGNRIRTTPSLLVKLRGAVDINLRARTTTSKVAGRLVTIFENLPDAQVSKFSMQINGGKKGILVVTRTRRAKINVCRAKQRATVETDGQNGREADFRTVVATPCSNRAGKAKRLAKRG